MFRESSNTTQLDMFDQPSVIKGLPNRAIKIYGDSNHWHNQFRQHVTYQIDENIFSLLYDEKNGCPNYPVRVLIAMMILKEGAGISDRQLFENCQFNILYRSALGLLNSSDVIPSESTYYQFRQQVKK